jgi:hypothetical protein
MKKTEDYTLLNLSQKVSGRSDLNSGRGFASKFSPYSSIRSVRGSCGGLFPRPWNKIFRNIQKKEEEKTERRSIFRLDSNILESLEQFFFYTNVCDFHNFLKVIHPYVLHTSCFCLSML